MTNSFRHLALLALVLAVPAGVRGQNPRSYPLAVLPFVERGKETKDLGPKVTDLLIVRLASDTGIVLVEREREDFRKVLDETQLGLSGLVNPEKAATIGQLTGAKLLVTGSVVQLDANLHLVAKIIGTETGRVLGAEARGNVRDDLSSLVADLSTQLLEAVQKRGDDLVSRMPTFDDRLAALQEKVSPGRRPTLFVQVSQQHALCPAADAAAETELVLFCRELGFPVVDRSAGSKQSADVVLLGEAASVVALRHGTLISVKVRLDVKALDRRSGLVVLVDRETARAVDLNEQLAAKAALQHAAATIAERILPKLAGRNDFVDEQ